MSKPISSKEWLTRFNKIYGDKFVYPNHDFSGGSKPIVVHCKIHGNFSTTPSKHAEGRGCLQCNKENDFNNRWENVVKEIYNVHKDKYIIPENAKTHFKTMWSKIPLICKDHGEFLSTISNCIDGSGCPECNPRKKKDTKWFIEEASKINFKFGLKYDYTKTVFTGAHNKLIITCLNCEEDFEQFPHNHLNGGGCNNCSNLLKRKGNLQFQEDFEKVHGTGFILEEYTTSMTKIKVICPLKHEFYIKPNDLLQGVGCYQCYNINNSSKGVGRIRKYLVDKDIKFEVEKIFKDCKNPKTNNNLRFDFYIPEYNICIEFDGQQHFKDIPLFGGAKEFINMRFRDSIKNEYCKNNNINLIRISYKDKNIEEILNKRLKNNE